MRMLIVDSVSFHRTQDATKSREQQQVQKQLKSSRARTVQAPGCGAAKLHHIVEVALHTKAFHNQINRAIVFHINILTMAPKQNLTGFNPRDLARAAGKPVQDPWARLEAWRYSGPFTRFERFRGTLPGLGIATVAFAGYLVYEQLFTSKDHHHSSSEGHH